MFLIALPSILSLMPSYSGKILVSLGPASGTYFDQTVIYIAEHHAFGAWGIIINKPLTPEQESIFDPEGPPQDIPMYRFMNGGPVNFLPPPFVVVPSPDELNGIAVVETSAFPSFASMDGRLPDAFKKLFYGYSGWGFLQLNREIMRGGWAVIDYEPELLWQTPTEKIWPKAIDRVLEDRPAAVGGV